MKAPISKYAIGLYAILCAAFGLNLLFLQPSALRPSSFPSHSTSLNEDKDIASLKRESHKIRSKTSSLTNDSEDTLTSLIEKTLRVPLITESLPQKDSVRALQIALDSRGYRTGETDGVVGPVTQAAILAFEFDHALPLTAEPQPYLLKKIFEGQSKERQANKGDGIPQTVTAEKIIRSVQETLQNLGYPIGSIDGQMNKKTITSIQQFEAQQGMPFTGRISGELIVRLNRIAMTASKRDLQ